MADSKRFADALRRCHGIFDFAAMRYDVSSNYVSPLDIEGVEALADSLASAGDPSSAASLRWQVKILKAHWPCGLAQQPDASEPFRRREFKKILKAIADTLGRILEQATLDGDTAALECLVTLLQAASIVNKTKSALEKRAKKNPLPLPAVEGGGGKSAEWEWAVIRPWLEKEFNRKLPERFPGDRFIRR